MRISRCCFQFRVVCGIRLMSPSVTGLAAFLPRLRMTEFVWNSFPACCGTLLNQSTVLRTFSLQSIGVGCRRVPCSKLVSLYIRAVVL
jgi:hypothetical protein